MTPTNDPVEVLCRYRVKPGKEQEFEDVLAAHWPVLFEAGLTTDQPAKVQKCHDREGVVAYVERFFWKSEASVRNAHEAPAVLSQWRPMGALCDDMEFWHVDAAQD